MQYPFVSSLRDEGWVSMPQISAYPQVTGEEPGFHSPLMPASENRKEYGFCLVRGFDSSKLRGLCLSLSLALLIPLGEARYTRIITYVVS